MYNVKTEKFEGPMELLLELIEKEKLSINEFSLAKVADGYLEYIKNNQNIHLENLAEFLSVASRLILIKSRSLLPMLSFNDEEEEEIKDLTHQLEEYKKFKVASLVLKKISEAGNISYSRAGWIGVQSVFYPPHNLNAYDLKKYFLSALSEIPIIEKLEQEIVAEVVTLEERINHLEQRLRQKISSSFSDMVSGAKDKTDVIISFLAMLEMIKQRVVQVEQGDLFSEIKLSLNKT